MENAYKCNEPRGKKSFEDAKYNFLPGNYITYIDLKLKGDYSTYSSWYVCIDSHFVYSASSFSYFNFLSMYISSLVSILWSILNSYTLPGSISPGKLSLDQLPSAKDASTTTTIFTLNALRPATRRTSSSKRDWKRPSSTQSSLSSKRYVVLSALVFSSASCAGLEPSSVSTSSRSSLTCANVGPGVVLRRFSYPL